MTCDMSLHPPGFQAIMIQASSLWSLDRKILPQIMYCQMLKRKKQNKTKHLPLQGMAEKQQTHFRVYRSVQYPGCRAWVQSSPYFKLRFSGFKEEIKKKNQNTDLGTINWKKKAVRKRELNMQVEPLCYPVSPTVLFGLSADFLTALKYSF